MPGSRWTLDAGGSARVRQQVAGGSYASQSDPRVRFGLGRPTGAARLEIALPGGGRTLLTGLRPGRYYVVDGRPGG